MLALIGILLIIACFTMPKSKIVFALALVFLWFLFAFNTENADYTNYSGIYERIGYGNQWTTSHYEGGFALLCRFAFNILKADYQGFLIMISTLCTIMLMIVVVLYTRFRNQNYALALFFITMYCSMICQYRFYIAMLVSLIALYVLMNNDSVLGYATFVGLILVAFAFHRSAVFYLVLLPINRMKDRSVLIALPVLSVGVLLVRTGLLSVLIAQFVPAYKIEKWIYAASNRSAIGIATVILVRIALVFIVRKAVDVIEGTQLSMSNAVNQFNSCRYIRRIDYGKIYKCVLICLLFVVMEVFDKDYERLFRLPLMLSFFMFSEYTYCRRISLGRMPVPYVQTVIYNILYVMYINYSFSGWIFTNVIPIFTQNALL